MRRSPGDRKCRTKGPSPSKTTQKEISASRPRPAPTSALSLLDRHIASGPMSAADHVAQGSPVRGLLRLHEANQAFGPRERKRVPRARILSICDRAFSPFRGRARLFSPRNLRDPLDGIDDVIDPRVRLPRRSSHGTQWPCSGAQNNQKRAQMHRVFAGRPKSTHTDHTNKARESCGTTSFGSSDHSAVPSTFLE